MKIGKIQIKKNKTDFVFKLTSEKDLENFWTKFCYHLK